MTGAAISYCDTNDDEGHLLSDSNVVDWPSTEEEDDLHVKECKTDDDADGYRRILSRNKNNMIDSISGGLPPRPRPFLYPVISPDKSFDETVEQETTQQPSASNGPSTNLNYKERLDEAERHVKILESNVTLHKRLAQLEDQLYIRDRQFEQLQAQMQQLLRNAQQQEQQILQLQSRLHPAPSEDEQWDAAVVTWKIAKFEKKLTADRHFFESLPFHVGFYASFYLTVCVLEVDDTVPESKRPVAIFLKAFTGNDKNTIQHQQQHQQQHSSIFPIRLDGSKITLVNNKSISGNDDDKTFQVGQSQMEDASQGKGVRQFISLGKLRESYLQNDASVVVRATVRVPHIPIYRLKTTA
ncbi:hypothetical protein IV203_008601 [Nitzschia inconspicua]|uniref:MATH domain-containing protein n=1 Tax=Nitzschia inconspicua TaxID=303405 RepID=A0A9K3KZ16_9STRA|nr:hypothetical protein IV203_008601 [Nitzschia inconspicua]